MSVTSFSQRFRRETLKRWPPVLAQTVLKGMYTGKRLYGLSRWLLPAAVRVARSTRERRLLMVYDMSSQSLSIGDILCYHEAALVLQAAHGCERVDFALVYEPANPLSSQNPINGTLSRDEFSYHFAPLLPLLQFSPAVGSILVFDSRAALERFVADNVGWYATVWPGALIYAGGEYCLYTILNDVLYSHFKRHGSLPRLTARQHLVDWATAFYAQIAASDVPVTVQLRSNPRFSRDRNSNVEAWLTFFRTVEDTHPAKFVIIGSVAESDDRVRSCGNVILAKDHGTSIEQDLALVQTSAFHMGADSGPVVMAIFGDRPYLCVNTGILPHLHRDMIQEGRFSRFFFAGPLQRYSHRIESSELLLEEFDRMWRSINVEAWNRVRVNAGQPLGSWLR